MEKRKKEADLEGYIVFYLYTNVSLEFCRVVIEVMDT